MEEKPLGKVIHYYDKIGVAIVRLMGKVKVGDKVKFVKGDGVFEQTVESIQVEHESLQEGKKGDEIGIKVDKSAKEGTLIYPA